MPPGLDSLRHIVVLMMENCSFDRSLGPLKAVDPRIDGLPDQFSNPDTTGASIPPQQLAEFQRQLNPDPDHVIRNSNAEPLSSQRYPLPSGPLLKGWRSPGQWSVILTCYLFDMYVLKLLYTALSSSPPLVGPRENEDSHESHLQVLTWAFSFWVCLFSPSASSRGNCHARCHPSS